MSQTQMYAYVCDLTTLTRRKSTKPKCV